MHVKISCFIVVRPFFPRISNSFGIIIFKYRALEVDVLRDDLYFSTQFNNHMNTGIGVSQSNISRNEYIYIYKKDSFLDFSLIKEVCLREKY